MNSNYPSGVTLNEQTIEGYATENYHSRSVIPRIALVCTNASVKPNADLFSEALKTLTSYVNEIAYIATNVDIPDHISYPPEGGFFFDTECQESRYLWRWITMAAPDLVIEIKSGLQNTVEISGLESKVDFTKIGTPLEKPGSLIQSLASGDGQTPGKIPGMAITSSISDIKDSLTKIVEHILDKGIERSLAGQELAKRAERSPLEVACILGNTYGFKLDEPINYIQGVAISGRLRLKKLDSSYKDPSANISDLVSFLKTEDGYEGNDGAGPNIAGMCWADELGQDTGDDSWNDLLVKAANTYEKVPRGRSPNPCHPDFGCEDMFYIATMLGRAFSFTGDTEYIESYVNFLLETKTQQPNGLFWHCRSTPYFWGRGNGFAALAFAEGLEYLPEHHPERDKLIEMHEKHMNAMRSHQLPNGMWTQLLDFPGTYQELSATCMTGYALAKGIRKGWLPKTLLESVHLAWEGCSKRISNKADLVDVCTGTGFQAKKSDYLYRAAEYGYDDRGGSMAIWFATEMELLNRHLNTK
ncbi:MAG: hypothetical protein CL887_05445 [Dehalococcoidia bacterium]|nr:hypothetical protein [Dehalococcoidia bacterium]